MGGLKVKLAIITLTIVCVVKPLSVDDKVISYAWNT